MLDSKTYQRRVGSVTQVSLSSVFLILHKYAGFFP